MGLLVEQILEVLGQNLGVSGVVPMMEVSQQRVMSWSRAAMVARKDAAQYPVNQGIVAGEPAVS